MGAEVMKIAIMSRWNATCGVSLHAELLVREWIKMGHDVVVFAPTIESASKDWHHKKIGENDEPWVIRCYEETDDPELGRIDINKILSYDFELFIVEAYNRLPLRELRSLISTLKRKVKTVAIIHCGSKQDVEPFVKLDFDLLIVFDERYINELLKDHLPRVKDKICIIPYPCMEPLNVKPKRPTFADGKTLFLSFGRQPPEEYRDYVISLRRLTNRYDFIYWIIRSDGPLQVSDKWIKQWTKKLSLEELYSYLKAADIHLLPKGNTRKVVVSSTVFQTLGSLVPIIAPDTRYFETIPTNEDGIGPLIKYKNVEDLTNKIIMLLEDDMLRRNVIKMAEEYVRRHSSRIIAKKYIDLFSKL